MLVTTKTHGGPIMSYKHLTIEDRSKIEVLITIMASLAQQESESISKNIKLGLQFHYLQGQVKLNTTNFLGYDTDSDGNLVINQEQVKIVKRIFK